MTLTSGTNRSKSQRWGANLVPPCGRRANLSLSSRPNKYIFDILFHRAPALILDEYIIYTNAKPLYIFLKIKTSFKVVSASGITCGMCHPFASANIARTSASSKFDSIASSRDVFPSPFTARGSAPLHVQ